MILIVLISYTYRLDRSFVKFLCNIMNKTRCDMKVEIEFKSGSVNVSQSMQKISSVVNSIKEQGFEIKQLEVETEKEE